MYTGCAEMACARFMPALCTNFYVLPSRMSFARKIRIEIVASVFFVIFISGEVRETVFPMSDSSMYVHESGVCI